MYLYSKKNRSVLFVFLSVVRQLKSGLDRLTVEVSRSHTVRHTHQVGPLSTSDQAFAEDATYTKHNKQKRRTSMPSALFEPAIPAVKRPQTDAVEVFFCKFCKYFSSHVNSLTKF
jgi:hypothetical protein